MDRLLSARRRRAVTLVAAVAVAASVAAEDSKDGPARAEGLERLRYEGLFPFYSRETFESGGVQTSAFFHLFRRTEEPDGDSYSHVLPFFYTSSEDGGKDRSLGFIPFYLRRRGPEKTHDVILLAFARFRDGKSKHTLLWPLFHAAEEPLEPHFSLIPTLFRHGSSGEADRERFGVPFFFEVFERSKAPDRTAYTLGNLFNFGEETKWGLPLGKLSLATGGYHAHLFPLFFVGGDPSARYLFTPVLGRRSREPDKRTWVAPLLLTWWSRDTLESDLDVLWPLVEFEETPARWTQRVLPFYFAGETRDAAGAATSGYRFFSVLYGRVDNLPARRSDHVIPLFLSHWGSAPNERELDVLWPLGHYNRRGEDFALRALPFFDRAKDARGSNLGIGGLLYRRHEDFERKTVGQWAPLPLVHWKKSPEGVVAWGVPAFYHRDEAQGGRRKRTTFVAPSLVSHVEEKTLPSGERVETKRLAAFWPVFGYDRRLKAMPLRGGPGEFDQSTYSTLFPFFWLARTVNMARSDDVRSDLNAPWPLVRYRSDPQSFDFWIFPLVYAEGKSARSKFQINPFIFKWETGRRDRTITGPLWWFHYRASSAGGWFHLLPIGFGEWKGDRGGLGVFPFYYHRRYGGDPIRYASPGRFFFLWNALESDCVRYHSLLWKAMESTHEGDDYDFRLFHRLFVNRSVKGQREVTVSPLFRWVDDKSTGEQSFSLLKILYRSEVRAGKATKRILFIPVSRKKVGA